jgi:agmatinase
MDLGVTNRAGARLGPRAVRAVERIGPYEHALRVAPHLILTAADIGDVPMQSRFSLEQCHADIEAFFTQVCAAGSIPLAVGGDPLDHLFDPQSRRPRTTGRHGAH